ncbi:uncharacterized protein G2W53_032150 [Senna tora]|uniref:Uncharacterized protein n=1 Tax=Senna tora TaxID=362788 RepID=A0A834WBJ0_9FABA|nr:uncharacterized protein G2W53_032150 [Senna tora]
MGSMCSFCGCFSDDSTKEGDRQGHVPGRGRGRVRKETKDVAKRNDDVAKNTTSPPIRATPLPIGGVAYY